MTAGARASLWVWTTSSTPRGGAPPLLRPRFRHPALPRHLPLPPRDHRLDATAAPSILDAVARRARASSDGVLVACAAAGLVAAVTVAVAWPALWPLALPGLAVGGFGGWGVADRTASDLAGEPGASRAMLGLLRALRLVAGVIGVAALVGFVLVMAMRTVLTDGAGWF